MEQTFKVKGMHCKSCEMLITDSLNETEGVQQATASQKSGIVNVRFDEAKVSPAQIKAIIQKEGYEV